MAERAAREGFRWIAITDHSRTAAYAGGMSIERVKAQWAEIDALNASGEAGIPILKGVESDILPDGSLDYPDDVLDGFDVVIGSVHSAFRQPTPEMTERLLRAVTNPRIHVFGHPTGRLLLGREGYAFDVPRVLDACAASGTAIELNANPHRLDLDESLLEEATRRGVRVSIDPDAHSLTGIEDVVFGVGAARRGRLRRGDVLTALPLEDFRGWCAKRRGKPPPPPLAFAPAAAEETGS
jgi:DNA polymerase (family 10)